MKENLNLFIEVDKCKFLMTTTKILLNLNCPGEIYIFLVLFRCVLETYFL